MNPNEPKWSFSALSEQFPSGSPAVPLRFQSRSVAAIVAFHLHIFSALSEQIQYDKMVLLMQTMENERSAMNQAATCHVAST